MKASATSATLSWRSRRQKSASGERAAISPVRGGRLIGDRPTGVLEQLGGAGAHGLRPCVICVPR